MAYVISQSLLKPPLFLSVYKTSLGTADSGTTTTLVDDALTQGDNYWNDMLLVITGGTNAGQARRISDFVAASDEITVDTAFDAAIDNTSVYAIILDRQAAGGGGDATAANQQLIMGTGFSTDTDSLVKIHDDHVTYLSAAPSTHAAADVWTVGTRALTDKAGFSISGTKQTLDALNDITAASVWAVATRALTDNALSTAGVDAIIDDAVEGTLTLRQAIRLIVSLIAGKSTGGGTTSLKYRDYGDTKDRLTFTVDASGNRSAVTRDVS